MYFKSIEHMEGKGGLNSGRNFDGVYGVVNNGPGCVFYSDGTIDVVTTHEAAVTGDIMFLGNLAKWALITRSHFLCLKSNWHSVFSYLRFRKL